MKKLVTYLLIIGLGLSTAMAAYAGGYKQKGWLDQETLDKLPPEKKELVVNALDKAREESMTQKDDIKAAMENVKTILTAPEFDAAAYKKATEELQTLMAQRFLAPVPIAQRAGFVAAVSRRLAPSLLQDGVWMLDYVRLRFAARLPA